MHILIQFQYNVNTMLHLWHPFNPKVNKKSNLSSGLESLKFCHQLKSFKISQNFKVNDQAGQYVFKTCSLLSDISIIDCPNIGDRTLRCLGSLFHLKSVNLSKTRAITDQGLRFIVDGHSGATLKKLTLRELNLITDISMLRISQKCVQLVELDVRFGFHNHTTNGSPWINPDIKTPLGVGGVIQF